MRLKLSAKESVEVGSLADASRAFRAYIDANLLGASQLHVGAGYVTEGGKAVARVSYNGRVWSPRAVGAVLLMEACHG
jgi:hypothetical protein